MHNEPIFPSLLRSKIPLIAFTLFLAFLFSFSFRFWGSSHPEPLMATFPVVITMLLVPVIIVGAFSFVIGFIEI